MLIRGAATHVGPQDAIWKCIPHSFVMAYGLGQHRFAHASHTAYSDQGSARFISFVDDLVPQRLKQFWPRQKMLWERWISPVTAFVLFVQERGHCIVVNRCLQLFQAVLI